MNWKKHKLPALLMLMIVVYSCASMGTPDGGPYDEEPPKFIRSSPKPYATNNKNKKIAIEFDEFIKLEKTSEKVVVSPPQLEQPDIKASGRRVLVNLMDSLKPNTTYTIDFSDAIVDNNEGNPLGNYAFSFSTGEAIDTLEVSGNVLAAADLEPVKGMMVGLHADLSDSAFVKKPFDRVSRTDSRGRFTIRGIAPGKYHIFGLMDGNQNYLYDSKTEMIAFCDSIIIPSMEAAVRQDTLWKDTATIDTIKTVGYTRFLPDNIVLRAFKGINNRQYLSKSERDKENHIIVSTGGQIPNNLAMHLDAQNVPILGTTAKDIDNAEDRAKFSQMLTNNGINQPKWSALTSMEGIDNFIERVGFPVLGVDMISFVLNCYLGQR